MASHPKKTKRACKLTKDLLKEFPFLHKGSSESDVRCNTCSSTFSIAHGGRNDIERHINTDKHNNVVKSLSSGSSISNFFRNEIFGNKEKELAKAEGLWAFHTVSHNQSFISMDCTSKLIQKNFEPKFSCARTKCEAIVKNVIAPFSREIVKNELSNVNFVSLYSDASNHKEIKIFPTLVRYFNSKVGVTIKILDFTDLPGETSDIIVDNLKRVIETHNLAHKVLAYCADNANTNFGGVRRLGHENVYFKLKKLLSNQKIVGVGCAAHIVHNAIQTASDLLPIDVESIINKIYSHFYIYTVRTTELQTFCDEVDVMYKKILGYCKTRWLALLPAVERVLKMFVPLKSYFLSQNKCPLVLQNFFSDPCSEIWLKFVHHQASIFHDTILKLEGDYQNFSEVGMIILDLKEKFDYRLSQDYVPLLLKNDLKFLINDGQINENYFMGHVRNFYKNVIDYLSKYCEQYSEFQKFNWIQLNKSMEWKDVEDSILYYMENVSNNLEENVLVDEISFVNKYVEKNLDRWVEDKTKSDQKWVEIFKYFLENGKPLKNCLKIVEYVLCIPGTNAPTERVFSLMNALWTSNKTNLKVETVSAIVELKYNMGSCAEFFDILQNDIELLKKINSVEKYDFKS